YSRNDAAGFQLKDNTIRSMQPLSGNRILLGSSSGLSVFNLESGEINSLNIPWENNRGKQNSFTVNSIEKTDENFWLIGSDGLAKLDLNLKKIESIQPKNIGKENNFLRLWGLHAGKDSIWICGLNGDLSLYLPSTNKIKYYKPDTSNQVFFQIKKSGDKILIAALGGIYIFNIYEEKFEFIPLPKNLNSIQTNALLALNKNRWLVATEGEGLFCFDETQKKFIVVAGNNNSILPGKVIYSLCMDAKKNFWAGSNCGLYKINSGDFSTELFTIHDGLQDNEFTYGKSIISLANGMVAAGGINGFNLFDPTKVSQNYSSISPRIDRYLAKDKMHYHPLNETNEISVRYKDKLLHLYLSFPDPIFRDKIEYKAMLKGVDDEWRNLGASGDWILSDFNPGNYTILLKACLAETGVAISETKNISFIVTPAFYQKWWFKIFILLLIVSIILTIFLFLYQRKITENKLLQTKLSLTEAEYQITEANMAALRSQMNPHFIFNALSSIQTLIFKNDKDGSINYLQKFAKLVRYILEKSGEQLVEVEEEIKFLTSYLDMQKLRHTDLEISITNNLPENSSHWRIPAMVIQPFLENAIEHAFLIKKAGAKLSLAFELEENSLRILIRDNGIWIKNSQSKITKKNHKSFGVVAVKKRLESISKKYNAKAEVSLKDLSETDDGLSGTEVVLVLPIIK
ncbi:MAG: histidine kinase, partial [Bacteroidetes bacterium]|nr:histidine kinase [Bacteroidota bacterium]